MMLLHCALARSHWACAINPVYVVGLRVHVCIIDYDAWACNTEDQEAVRMSWCQGLRASIRRRTISTARGALTKIQSAQKSTSAEV